MTIKNNRHSLKALIPNNELKQRIFNERAHQLAKQSNDKDLSSELINYVRFRVNDNELYGIPFQYVKEVMLSRRPTRLPHSPMPIIGIINHQGLLLSIIDLKLLFHMTSNSHVTNYLIVITVNSITAAIAVDNIEGSDSYERQSLEAPINSHNAIKSTYILGLHKGTTTILNIETLLLAPQLSIISS